MRNVLAALLLFAAVPAAAQDKEKLFTTDLSVRTVLAFKVPDAVAQKLLPVGFELNSPAAGPSKGYNLGMTMIDYLMVQDPEGKTVPPRTTLAINMPVKKTASGEAVGLVVGGFIVPAGAPGAYSVFAPANIAVDRRSDTADEKSTIAETWVAKAADGSMLAVELQFTRGVPIRGKGEAKPYSAAKTDFYRIYRFDQAVDVARSAPSGIDRVSKFSFKASGPKLAPLFNGSEQLISITSIPFYARSIYLPVM